VAGDPTGIDGALQGVDGLAAVQDAQQLTPEHVVEEVVAQEHGAQQSAEVRDRLIERIAAGG